MKTLPLFNADYINLHRDFTTSAVAQGYSRGDSNVVVRSAREFLFFLEAKQISDIKDVKAKEIIAYYEYLKERPNIFRDKETLSESYIRSQMTGIRYFFDYLVLSGRIISSPAHIPKFNFGKGEQRYVLTEEEIKLLYNSAVGKIETAILAIGYGCGLRREEMENLNVSDIILSKGLLNVRKGKGNKSRTVPMAEGVLAQVKDYLIYDRPSRIFYDEQDNPAFFINNRGVRMKGENIYNRLKKMVERTGNKELMSKHISTHCLRHSIATHMIDRGADIEFVRKFLGHVHLDTTVVYSKRRKQRLKLYNMLSEHLMKNNMSRV